MKDSAAIAFFGVVLALGAAAVGGWITHIITCLSDGSWGFLIAGALLPPIGIIHGIGIWFGVW